jgi:YidC/Oxa1 family membrane protein insertase
MMVWAQFVDLIYGVLVCVSTALGGSMGWAIAVVSLVVRVVMLPLTLRMAYRGLETQLTLRRLEPQLKRVRAKYKKDQRRVAEETALLYRKHGVKLADGRSMLSMVLQLPIFLGLSGAIRRGLGDGGSFLWVKNIATPDLPLAAICAGLAALSASLAPGLSASQRTPMVLLPALLTLVFLSRLAAGLSIYALAQGLVGLGQAVLVRRRARQLLSA